MYLYKTLKNLLLMNFFSLSITFQKFMVSCLKGLKEEYIKKFFINFQYFKIYIIQPKNFSLRIPKLWEPCVFIAETAAALKPRKTTDGKFLVIHTDSNVAAESDITLAQKMWFSNDGRHIDR